MIGKQPIIALYFKSETVLKFYNLDAWSLDYKTIFILNLTEHELCSALKIKMPTIEDS